MAPETPRRKTSVAISTGAWIRSASSVVRRRPTVADAAMTRRSRLKTPTKRSMTRTASVMSADTFASAGG